LIGVDDYAETKEIVPFMEAPLLGWLNHNYLEKLLKLLRYG